MATVLALHSCCCHNVELINQESLSFSNSISDHKVSKIGSSRCNRPRINHFVRLKVEMQQNGLPSNVDINGKGVRMVPASEAVKRKTSSANAVEKVNGVKNRIDKVNGSVVNGSSLVRSQSSASLVKTPKVKPSKELPPVEELKILPSDEGFSWANENYNAWQRTIDVWSFVLSLRVRILFDNAKWAYIGGFTEDEQVGFGTCLCFL